MRTRAAIVLVALLLLLEGCGGWSSYRESRWRPDPPPEPKTKYVCVDGRCTKVSGPELRRILREVQP